MDIVLNGKCRRFSVAPKSKTLYSKDMLKSFFGRGRKVVCFFLSIWLASQIVFSQENETHNVPNIIRRPDRGEAPRFPMDLVIGELGQGEAPFGAYSFSRSLLLALMEGRREAPALTGGAAFIAESAFEEIRSIRPRTFRLGGGRIEADGCVSFLVRFIGRDESITGELFVRRAEAEEDGGFGAERWLLDDLILEDSRTLADLRDIYRFNFSPYERFF